VIKGDEEENEVVAEEIIPLSARGEPLLLPPAATFHIRIERKHLNEDDLKLLRNLILYHKGNTKVIVHIPTNKGEEIYTLGEELKVKPSTRLMDEVSSLLGKDCVWVE
jgi:hypothetical protein